MLKMNGPMLLNFVASASMQLMLMQYFVRVGRGRWYLMLTTDGLVQLVKRKGKQMWMTPCSPRWDNFTVQLGLVLCGSCTLDTSLPKISVKLEMILPDKHT